MPTHQKPYPLVPLVLVLLWVVATSFNLTKAVHIDDTAYLEIARHIVNDPLHPMSGMVSWGSTAEPAYRTNNPFLIHGLFALIMRLFGESELLFHVAISGFSMLAIACFYGLARKLAPDSALPLTATLCLGPAFVPAQNLMLDIPLVSLSIAFFWILICFNSGRRGAAGYILAAFVAGAACLAKYPGVVLFPILIADIVLRKRWRLLWVAAIPLSMIGVWSLFNYLDYGGIHILDRKVKDFDLLRVIGYSASWTVCLGAISPFALWLVPYWKAARRGWVFLAGCGLLSVTAFAYGLAAIKEPAVQSLLRGIFVGGGVAILSSVVLLSARMIPRDATTAESEDTADFILLFLWFAGSASFVILLAPFIATRHVLTTIPAILLVLGHMVLPSIGKNWIRIGVGATILLGMALGISDWEYAHVYRVNAGKIRDDLGTDATIWYMGHWGWQWYAGNAGMKQYDRETSSLSEGDFFVIPRRVQRPKLHEHDKDRLRPVTSIVVPSNLKTILRTMLKRRGLYNSTATKLPWTISTDPVEKFEIYHVVAPERVGQKKNAPLEGNVENAQPLVPASP